MIRVLMSITLFWFCTLPPTFAQGLSLPPGITSESAAQGWIALFDGETTFGWNAQGPVQINDGCLIIGGELPASLSTTTHFLANDMELEFCSVSDKHSFKLKFGNTHSNHDGKGNSTGWDTVKFQNRTISSPAPYVISTEPGTVIKIRSCIIKPVGARSIFNGKDLTGWKEFPGRKSRYSVTSRGELNVLDGAGDLQTLEEFDDFLLQLDIISNGDHLNSGIFFRCLPGEWWSGYEAQIRNEWQSTVTLKNGQNITGTVTDKGESLVVKVGREVKSLRKDEIDSLTSHRNKPVDIGTGGIYHFCPARKVVSNDREYFKMTVVAHQNHLAVWVNGYMTAEYTDNRPVNVSARKGRKDTKGPLSIQGHDPTTNLSFKNIEIISYSKKD